MKGFLHIAIDQSEARKFLRTLIGPKLSDSYSGRTI